MSAAKADKERLSDEWKSQTGLCCRLRWSDNLLNCSRQSVSQSVSSQTEEKEEEKKQKSLNMRHTAHWQPFFSFLFFPDRLFSGAHCLAAGYKRASRCLHICTVVFFFFFFLFPHVYAVSVILLKSRCETHKEVLFKKSPINWRK